MALGMATTLRDARNDTITTAIGNAGKLKLYNGSQPSTGGSATTLLATLILASPAAPTSVGGLLTFTLPASVTAVASSTCTWGRFTTSGDVFVQDATAGTSGTDIIIAGSSSITSGQTVSVTLATITDGNP